MLNISIIRSKQAAPRLLLKWLFAFVVLTLCLSSATAYGNGTSYANSHVEAGNLLSIESGDDTNLLGAQAKGQTVKAKVGGDLNIISLQDVNHYDSKQTNGGVSVSICVPPICVGTSSVSGNFSQEKMKSNYAGVAEQSGIIAGTGGFEIDVKGNTDLKGGAIVSAADASKNHLTTGTLTTSDIKNTSSYKASSMGISASYSPSGGGIGNTGISAGAPSFMNASDKDASITRAGISAGTVEITNQSAQTALTGQTSDQTIAELNRDTTPAEQLKDLWSEDKKAEIRNGFEIVKTLGQNTSTFMSIMASDIDAAKKAKDEIGNKILTLADGTPAIDQTTGQSVTIADLNDPRYEAFVAANPGVAQALGDYNNASAHYTTLDNIWGNGGYGSMILTGLVGAASGNVTGSGTALLQNTAINVVRQYGANEIKGIADGFMTDGTPNAESETIRGLLHSIAGCAGAAATGGDCASAAAGSAATVALNNLIGTDTTHMTAAQKQAYSNLIGTIVGGVTSAVGGDAGAAQLASKVEVENNFLYPTELKNMRAERRQCSAGTDKATEASCLSKVETKYTRISTGHNFDMSAECIGNPSGPKCTEMKSAAASYVNDSYIRQINWGASSVTALKRVNSMGKLTNTPTGTIRPIGTVEGFFTFNTAGRAIAGFRDAITSIPSGFSNMGDQVFYTSIDGYNYVADGKQSFASPNGSIFNNAGKTTINSAVGESIYKNGLGTTSAQAFGGAVHSTASIVTGPIDALYHQDSYALGGSLFNTGTALYGMKLLRPIGVEGRAIEGFGTGYANGTRTISGTVNGIEGVVGTTPATSLVSRAGLREDLAAQANIPRNIVENPSGIWGSSIDQLKQSFEMDGATVTPISPRSSSSGFAEVFNVDNSATGIKQIERHPGGGAHGDALYYKIVKSDGSEIRIIDTSKTFNPGTITSKQTYLNSIGQKLKYENSAWGIWK